MGTYFSHGRRWGATVALLALAGAALTPVTAAAEPPSPAAPPQRVLTLLSGDQVVVRGQDVVTVRPGPGREELAFHKVILNGHRFVYPSDALPLVRAGRLDETLFDVTELLRQRFDETGVLPVLLTRPPQSRARRDLPAASTVTRELPALGVTALTRPAERAGEFWASLTGPSLRAAEGKFWLNRRLSLNLDQSAAVIGAPQVWQAGGTGSGVKVGVLDSGYDQQHPDLTGRVAAAESFLQGVPVQDSNGHGTHVASTIAGTGKASGGRYRGIAYDANLLIGKVCDEYCPEDSILAGMQWAADQGAKVVNMSLGGPPTDGTDPLSQAVNTLSAQKGTLFVIAAGNNGSEEAVESPGSADAALTVAASTKSGQLAPFSARGPRHLDHAAKPDITAPGVDIVAARAAGTLPQFAVSEQYLRLSGTSMATPHVAGAAAVLAQRNPGWTGEQLKAALMGTATPLHGVDVFGQGVGRLDLARAHQQRVRVEPASLSMGSVPTGGEQPAKRKLRYSNDSDRPVTLKLDLPAHGGLLTADAKQVTVPAKGSAEVTVTADFTKATGLVGARLTATGDGVQLRTSVVAERRPADHIVTVKSFSHQGKTDAFTLLVLQNLDTGKARILHNSSEGVPAGRYRVIGQVIDTEYPPGLPNGVFTDRVKLVQEITVDRDTEIVLDGRKAKPINVRVDDPQAVQTPFQLGHEVGVFSDLPGKQRAGVAMLSKPGREFVLPSAPAPGLVLYSNTSWNRPLLSAKLGDRELNPRDLNPLGFRGERTAKVADTGGGTPEEIAKVEVRGAFALMQPGRQPTVEINRRVAAAFAAGAAGVILDDAGAEYRPEWPGPVINVYGEASAALRAQPGGSVTVRGIANSPSLYVLHDRVTGRLPDGIDWLHAAKDLGKARTRIAQPGTGELPTAVQANVQVGGMWFGSVAPVRVPAELDVYYTPGLDWITGAALGQTERAAYGIQETLPITFRAGQIVKQSLFTGPFGPELHRPAITRTGDKVRVELPMFSQSGGLPASGYFSPDFDKGRTSLSANGKRLGGSDVPGIATVDVPERRQLLELTAEGSRALPGVDLGTKSSATWKVHSGQTAKETSLPLLDIRYDLPLDLANRAKPGEFAFAVNAPHQAGSGGRGAVAVTMEASTDDGATWHPVPVLPAGKSWTAKVTNPASGFVSLRTKAIDADGGSVTETLVRAYRVG
ncbi:MULTISPECIES: S8 family serine peptidase [unclassified Crossiella]|uniref:S8 family peptidase n=1 Tax=unclassified Crossiella TaxID=2620835 RepID=UPI001FFEA534|nr:MULTISPECIES: S8 family serine peptidase [unclassified Crossiella]MCK2239342.1 S8 family serine peptidase [Crossiella sp. S99.2]MCK2252037.1 S8 family serine peptidase [Crossiella sp. S99.1]